tara:strand:- start:842 stop:1021 length:180 start_codon:yes stop_codon:yes gene_type:complete
MYTVKEIAKALLNCKTLIEFGTVMNIVNYLSRAGDFNEEQKYAIEAAAIVKRRTFKFRK